MCRRGPAAAQATAVRPTAVPVPAATRLWVRETGRLLAAALTGPGLVRVETACRTAAAYTGRRMGVRAWESVAAAVKARAAVQARELAAAGAARQRRRHAVAPAALAATAVAKIQERGCTMAVRWRGAGGGRRWRRCTAQWTSVRPWVHEAPPALWVTCWTCRWPCPSLTQVGYSTFCGP